MVVADVLGVMKSRQYRWRVPVRIEAVAAAHIYRFISECVVWSKPSFLVTLFFCTCTDT
jgi:hypothetical protein